MCADANLGISGAQAGSNGTVVGRFCNLTAAAISFPNLPVYVLTLR